MKSAALRGRRLALFCGITGVAVLALAGYLGRTWIHDHWLLHRLPGMPEDVQGSAIAGLVERQRAGVTPHLLHYYREHPYRGSMGMALGAHRARVSRIVAIGPGAVPHLARAIDGGDFDRSLIFDSLARFGAAAKAALPAILRHLETAGDGDTIGAIGSLGEAGAPAVPALLRFARDPNELRRRGVYRALGNIGPPARAALPILLEALSWKRDGATVMAARAVERIEPGRKEIVPSLIGILNDDLKDFGRAEAAGILAELGTSAREAVPALLDRMREDSDVEVVYAAAAALDSLDPAVGIPEAVRLSREEKPESRLTAATALGGFRSRAGEALSALLRLMEAPEEEIAQRALWSLGQLGVATPEVLAVLAKRIPQAHREENFQVARTVVKLSEKSPRVVEMLLELLRGDRQSKLAAIRCLEMMEERAAPALPFLEALAGNSDQELSRSAGSAGWTIRQALSGPVGRAAIDQAGSAYYQLTGGK